MSIHCLPFHSLQFLFVHLRGCRRLPFPFDHVRVCRRLPFTIDHVHGCSFLFPLFISRGTFTRCGGGSQATMRKERWRKRRKKRREETHSDIRKCFFYFLQFNLQLHCSSQLILHFMQTFPYFSIL